MLQVQVKTAATRQAAASIIRDLVLGAPVALEQAVEDVAHNARQRPEYYQPRRGMAGLQGATRAELLGTSGGKLVARVVNDARNQDGKPFAIAVHQGARPHEIRARRAPRLVFFWPKVGRVVAFKKVDHPGNKAMPFLETPRRYGETRLVVRMLDLVGTVVRRYSVG